MKRITLILAVGLTLAGCAPRTPGSQLGPDGQPIPVAYTIGASEAAAIPNRVLEQVNILRSGSSASPLTLDPALSAAAAAHSRDMAAQNRAWHFGSDGSSPLDRARRAGYAGELVGENISESYENDIATLQAWMETRDTRDVIMDPTATTLGIAWYQEPSKKIWWTLITGK
ncbi:CAP domain-containing protein [Paracoccus sediminicola]|uniref:CAP domain-containing protein n=1 Tax=Paracoccus sediminicola TaxID=3017783 RepID=UPI0022EFE464|nr:CAP domain-containing protein [Paracoccus sediminicola]WBU56948.1 CAP domain-containing protein [Paracoccus sediminicola]